MITRAHNLGLAVTGEGIETTVQARRLIRLGSDSLQGYYFSRPSPNSAPHNNTPQTASGPDRLSKGTFAEMPWHMHVDQVPGRTLHTPSRRSSGRTLRKDWPL
ncbi:EAL domain-containing protein [Arthrobacter oryzae]|uniref:EAL domain-containing protein n=2 Tax=Arthrobacter oryzae TaxID=409290 RepID=A0A3N0C0P5_9MICC|nr:EAL domain-containing protein [Arthrobacter oryzae]